MAMDEPVVDEETEDGSGEGMKCLMSTQKEDSTNYGNIGSHDKVQGSGELWKVQVHELTDVNVSMGHLEERSGSVQLILESDRHAPPPKLMKKIGLIS